MHATPGALTAAALQAAWAESPGVPLQTSDGATINPNTPLDELGPYLGALIGVAGESGLYRGLRTGRLIAARLIDGAIVGLDVSATAEQTLSHEHAHHWYLPLSLNVSVTRWEQRGLSLQAVPQKCDGCHGWSVMVLATGAAFPYQGFHTTRAAAENLIADFASGLASPRLVDGTPL